MDRDLLPFQPVEPFSPQNSGRKIGHARRSHLPPGTACTPLYPPVSPSEYARPVPVARHRSPVTSTRHLDLGVEPRWLDRHGVGTPINQSAVLADDALASCSVRGPGFRVGAAGALRSTRHASPHRDRCVVLRHRAQSPGWHKKLLTRCRRPYQIAVPCHGPPGRSGVSLVLCPPPTCWCLLVRAPEWQIPGSGWRVRCFILGCWPVSHSGNSRIPDGGTCRRCRHLLARRRCVACCSLPVPAVRSGASQEATGSVSEPTRPGRLMRNEGIAAAISTVPGFSMCSISRASASVKAI